MRRAIAKNYICEICGEPFTSRSTIEAKYCSPECRYQAILARSKAKYIKKDLSCVCGHCGKVFQKTSQRQEFCCKACWAAEHSTSKKVSDIDFVLDDTKPYEALAIAIIAQAVDDYRQALRDLENPKKKEAAEHTIKKLDKFFKSEWYGTLTSIPADIILKKIRAEVSA